MKNIPFTDIVGPTYTLDSINVECQRCVNLIPEKVESGKSENSYYLKPSPGLREFCTLFQGPIRAIYTASNNRVFAFGGDDLYELFIDGSTILRGTTDTSLEKVKIIDNGQIIMLVRGALTYTFKFSDNTFVKLVDVSYLGGNFVNFLDQYFLTLVPNSQQFQISPLAFNRSQPYSGIDVFSAESSPDNLIASVVNGREYWLFGQNSYEVWFNTGDGDRPFQRIRDAAFNIGTIAPESVLTIAGQVFWLGASKEGFGIVWSSSGYQPTKISNQSIESQIADSNANNNAYAWSYQLKGHFFYILNCPTINKTFAYDITTELWHELEYREPVTDIRSQHRAGCQTFAFNKNLVGDSSTNQIYELTDSVYTDNEDPIIRYRRTPHISEGKRLVFYKKLELELETGIGLVSGQGSDPLISLRFSDDYGHTWSNYKTKSIGKIGEYKKNVIFTQLGASKDRVFEIQISDPVPFRLISAELGLEIGVH